MYQGHLNDGSSVQAHSAGSLYPYVLFARQTGETLTWGYINPKDGAEVPVGTYEQAHSAAAVRKEYAASFRPRPAAPVRFDWQAGWDDYLVGVDRALEAA